MDIFRPSTTTESRAPVVMVHYYRDMWPRRSHILAPLPQAASVTKGRKILWNDTLEISFKELNLVVSAETLLSYPDQKLTFTVHTYASDKQVGAVIIQNNKTIAFFSRILSKPQRNYITTDKEILAVVECLKQLQGIVYVYKINVLSYHKNLVYAATLSSYQRLMCLKLILEEFGPTVHHIYGVDNIVYDMLSILPYTPSDKYDPCTSKQQYCENDLFEIGKV